MNNNYTDMRAAAILVATKLIDNGFNTYFVGGGVRDRLLNLPVKDIDITTDAHPDDVIKLFPGSGLVGKSFGVIIVNQDGFHFEVATFRIDGEYIDCRRPESVQFGTMEEDANRRDFTINALYEHPITGDITDFFTGRQDIKDKVLRCVGDPNLRFAEDHLRMLRAIRFSARFNFQIENETFEAIIGRSDDVRFVAPERVRDELDKMITNINACRALELLFISGLLSRVLPEVANLDKIPQDPTWHPEGDCFFHTKLVLQNLTERTSINAWSCLLHDIGKAVTTRMGEDGRLHAYEHHKVGADMTREILNRLKFSTKKRDMIVDVVYDHMKPMTIKHMKRSKLRRFLGKESTKHVLTLHRSDCLSSNGDLSHYEFAEEVLKSFADEPVLPAPLINGRHLIKLSIKPGPIFADLLQKVQTQQLDGIISTEDEAIMLVRELIK